MKFQVSTQMKDDILTSSTNHKLDAGRGEAKPSS